MTFLLTSEYVPKYGRWVSSPTVALSELSKNSKRVAETLDRAQRVHVTRRDGEDLHLTTPRHDQQREETADITTRILADPGLTAKLTRRLPDEDHGEGTAP
ncbi:hypothetical protein GCM10010287_29400 [Streptomyces variabilis]|uniref:Antitoxin n=1 Tax=Streptomyces variabilis TaxID=67372 RepID=A0ABQ2U005_9ACTN|nr:hypothetical protein GCM10010265_41030 [Streptomyces griseoincarnatus]GGT53531.1 hypothetical protein GCM10010287_29400 [Streptomyces variabilis]